VVQLGGKGAEFPGGKMRESTRPEPTETVCERERKEREGGGGNGAQRTPLGEARRGRKGLAGTHLSKKQPEPNPIG
jgi:hypothetical protein